MLSSSHRNSGASRIRPYLTTSLSPDASSRSGSVRSVAMSMSTHLCHIRLAGFVALSLCVALREQ